ncbi:hypothetical protein Q5M85_03390 [Paraclostridium bifermentans]|nr:hypothetical protein [Paraclostridium bifermentans]
MSKNLQMASITPDNLNDSGFIDSLKLTKDERKIGTVKFLIFSAIAIMIFFIPIEQNGKHNILFGIIYNAIVNF